ncbi:hypothetical protein XA68_14818 [Ophiocordyceps unilateralis]|uniref:Major facilitator superfamily (MFS) profile domain-containing protein n=1 Tax=Ophiocordyceps unilateralis TaxID=268505 RepID=A0A2A9PLA8_OPHUN|nr:hypothetical protein XA68_14818 [Ophiocordyceps unilateralis]
MLPSRDVHEQTPLLSGKPASSTPVSSSSADPSSSESSSTPPSRQSSPSGSSSSDSDSTSSSSSLRNHSLRPPGVARVDAAFARLSALERTWLFGGIFLVGCAYGLESQVRVTYQPYATSSFSLHPYLSTINVLRSVVAVAVQPTAAKVADVVGRFEVVAAATACYVVGMAIEASAASVYTFCAGGLVYQVGYTAIVLVLEVLVADVSSMRARVFFSYVPALPFVVNAWVGGALASAVLSVSSWRWGIAMWCLVYPLASLPLLVTLYLLDRRRAASSPAIKPAETSHAASELLQQLDVVGLVGLVVALALVLAPLTVAGGADVSRWKSPLVLVPLVAGLALLPLFVLWERSGARMPLVPMRLLADRGVWSALAVRGLLNLAWSVQGNYLYTVLVVAFDFSVETATRILSLFSFCGVVSGVLVGMVVYRLRRLKAVIVVGTCLFTAGLAVLYYFPGGADLSSAAGVIAGQVLLGLASGFFAYPTQASIQASATRDHVAVMTGLYLSLYNIGSALGTSLSGALWTEALPPALSANLAFQPNATLARATYHSPFDVVARYPVGTEVRSAVIASYRHVQRLLCLAGIVACLPMIAFALALRNPRLSKRQVQPDAAPPSEESVAAG